MFPLLRTLPQLQVYLGSRVIQHRAASILLQKADEMILVREVVAVKAHIASKGETRENFEVV